MSDHHHAGNRREDMRLITGRGRYTSDLNLPGQLYGHFVRSDRPHAEIIAVSTEEAARMPGVKAILTGADALAAGYTQFQNLVTVTGLNGQPILRPEHPVLAAKRVRHVGEALALVVADSAIAAQEAAEAVNVEYRDLPVVVDVEQATQPGAVQLHDNVPGNLSFEWEAGDRAAAAEEFAKAAHVTTLKVRTSRVLPNPMEPRAHIVSYSAADDSYDIYTCAQGINLLKKLFSFTSNVPEDKIRLHVHDVGGSFGQRSPFYPEHGALMIASKKLGRPVKWVSTRSEGFLADSHGRGIVIKGELALDRGGKFLAARFDFLGDMGAYLSAAGSASHTRNPATCMTGVYQIPALHGRFRLGLTTTTPIAPYRGAGRPDMAYIIERLVSKAAQEMGLDPVELRRMNFIPPDAFPYKSMTGGTYDACNFNAVLNKGLDIADWTGFAARKAKSTAAGKLRGIGISTVIENTGAGVFPKDQVQLEFSADGRITAHTLAQSSGQSHETTFAMVVADTLGIDAEQVAIVQSPLDHTLIGNHTGGSRSMAGAGSICKVAALKAIEQGKSLAAVELGVEPSQVDYAKGVFSARESAKHVSFGDLAKKHGQDKEKVLRVLGEGSVGSTFPNGCHVAEVEIDPETGVTEIVNYTAVDDSGTVVSHPVVEGQVHGAVIQGAGQVFGEEGVYDAGSGQFLTGSFMDYFMPRAGMIRSMTVGDEPLPTKLNVLGAKGVGEAGCGGSLPALTNAVMNALGPLGIHHLDMPLTSNKLWHAIQGAKHRQ
jgi:aerobic carbon-monoxide dehydrogenase large subunit